MSETGPGDQLNLDATRWTDPVARKDTSVELEESIATMTSHRPGVEMLGSAVGVGVDLFSQTARTGLTALLRGKRSFYGSDSR